MTQRALAAIFLLSAVAAIAAGEPSPSCLAQYAAWLKDTKLVTTNGIATATRTTDGKTIEVFKTPFAISEDTKKFAFDFSMPKSAIINANGSGCYDGEKTYVLDKETGKAIAYASRVPPAIAIPNPLVLPIQGVLGGYYHAETATTIFRFNLIYDVFFECPSDTERQSLALVKTTVAPGANPNEVTETYTVDTSTFMVRWRTGAATPVPIAYEHASYDGKARFTGSMTWEGTTPKTFVMMAAQAGPHAMSEQVSGVITAFNRNDKTSFKPIVFDMEKASSVFDAATNMTLQ